jgi:aryl-alcohol dehydrogenase-like predicted oxidoreductase
MRGMEYRAFGRLGWRVSEIGYGTWGMGGWSGSEDEQSVRAMERAVQLGCNFFDSALAYGDGHSERLLSRVVRNHKAKRLCVATKVPPKNKQWPGRDTDSLGDVFPRDHVRASTEQSLQNLGIDCIDLQQFHVWSDAWAGDERWMRAVEELKSEGLIRGFGISINRWQPANVLRAIDTGLVDAVQVVYNVFDQSPEDELFPVCLEKRVAVIARVPFDEGSLTGQMTRETRFPENDFRSIYFTPERLAETMDHVDALVPLVPEGSTLPDLVLRHILQHPAVSTIIPGMRKLGHVERNMAASDGQRLPEDLYAALKTHRWDRAYAIS